MVVVPLLLDDEVQRLVDEAVASQEGIRHRILRDSATEGAPGILCSAFRENICVKPHKHSEGDEVYCHSRGKYSLILFSAQGIIDRCVSFPNPNGLSFIIPRDNWHTIVVREPSVIYTIYRAVYNPTEPEKYKQIPSWAPSNNPEEQKRYMRTLVENIQHI
ncbi:MAG: WbuC family cupin fold metalloprotein [Nanoarchaeota archaeon]